MTKTLRRAVVLVASSMLLLGPAGAAAQNADPQAVVTAFFAAANAGEVEAALAHLTDEAVVRFAVGSPATPEGARFVGPAGLRATLQAQAAGNVRNEVSDFQVAGERVTWRNLHANNPFRLLGISPLEYRGEAVVQEGRIASLTLSFTPDAVTRLLTAQTVATKTAFDAALNAHDVDAAVATFAEDARFITPGGAVLTGPPQIRAYLQQLVAEDYRAEVAETRQLAPDTVQSRGTIALDPFRRLGLASVEATADVVVQGSRITSFRTALTPLAAARLQAAQAAAQRSPVQLPRTGDPAGTPADTRPGALPAAAGAVVLALGLARRWQTRGQAA